MRIDNRRFQQLGGFLMAGALLTVAACEGKAAGTDVLSPGAVPKNAITLTVKDRAFDQEQLVVKAGQEVRLTLQNQDREVHDWRLVGAVDRFGSEVVSGLPAAGSAATLAFTLNMPGTFSFQCDIHAARMRGKFFVVQ